MSLKFLSSKTVARFGSSAPLIPNSGPPSLRCRGSSRRNPARRIPIFLAARNQPQAVCQDLSSRQNSLKCCRQPGKYPHPANAPQRKTKLLRACGISDSSERLCCFRSKPQNLSIPHPVKAECVLNFLGKFHPLGISTSSQWHAPYP